MAAADKVVVGKFAAAWGVRGWLHVHAFTDPPQRILEWKRHYCQIDGQWQALTLAASRVQGNGDLVAQPRGCDSREQAAQYRQCLIAVDASELPALDDGEYYWHQLQGLRVLSVWEGQTVWLGVVDHLIETGANDVMVVRPCQGSVDQRERLLPYLPGQYVEAVDLAAGEVRVVWDPAF